MSNDTATWTCPKCGHRIESERIVDETFVPRVDAHKTGHWTSDNERFDDYWRRFKAWQALDNAR